MKLTTLLQGEHITLRNYEPDDLAFCTQMWFDEENGKYLSDPTSEYVDEVYQNALDHLQDSEQGYYLIATLRDGTPVGSACAFPTEGGGADIGYCVHKKYWRQGFGGEIVSLLLDWLAALGAKQVTAEVATENYPSRKLLERLGFTVLRESSFQKYHMNVRFDSLIYGKSL